MYYEIYGRKWGDPDYGTESGEITWSADLGSNFQFDGGDTQAEFDAALQDAFDAWETIADIDFKYVSSGDADINVIVDEVDGQSYGTVGFATWGGGTSVTNGTVTLDEAEDWAPTGDGGIDFYAVSLHEIGHILGLAHYIPESGDPAQIMNSSVSVDDLQSGDIAGAQYLYGTGDGVAPPPPPDDPVDPEVPEDPVDPEVPVVPEDPVEPDEETPPVVISADDDGGSSGGAAGLIVALLGIIAAMFLGGGAGLVGLAAGSVAEGEDDDDEDTGEDVLLTDLLPVMENGSHGVFVDDLGNFIEDPDGHDDDYEEEDFFLV